MEFSMPPSSRTRVKGLSGVVTLRAGFCLPTMIGPLALGPTFEELAFDCGCVPLVPEAAMLAGAPARAWLAAGTRASPRTRIANPKTRRNLPFLKIEDIVLLLTEIRVV